VTAEVQHLPVGVSTMPSLVGEAGVLMDQARGGEQEGGAPTTMRPTDCLRPSGCVARSRNVRDPRLWENKKMSCEIIDIAANAVRKGKCT
jgi:hypothetical protein